MAGDPLHSDLAKASLIAAGALLAVCWFVAIAVVVPGLVNLHNDGALILAVIVAIGVTAFAFIIGRQLWRAFNIGDNA
jgi:hypothetical protein